MKIMNNTRIVSQTYFVLLSLSFVGNTEIDIDIKRYYCKAGIKNIQVSNYLFV